MKQILVQYQDIEIITKSSDPGSTWYYRSTYGTEATVPGTLLESDTMMYIYAFCNIVEHVHAMRTGWVLSGT